MLKRLFAFFLCSAALAASAATEGTDYAVLDTPIAGGEGKITKLFTYDCPFCFRYDTSIDPRMLPRVEKEFGLTYNPVHLEVRGRYGRLATELFAACLLRDRAAGIAPTDENSLFRKAKEAVFFAYHKKAERWKAGESAFIATVSEATGISAEELSAARTDPEVVKLCEDWAACVPAGKVQGIPAYVINGKYLILIKSVKGVDGMVKLIGELNSLP